MNQLLSIGKELVWTFCSVVASFILAIIRVVIPPARKSVKNETVLITGTGTVLILDNHYWSYMLTLIVTTTTVIHV